MKRLSVELPDALHAQLKLAALSDGITLSSLVVGVLTQHLEERAARAPHPMRRATDHLPDSVVARRARDAFSG